MDVGFESTWGYHCSMPRYRLTPVPRGAVEWAPASWRDLPADLAHQRGLLRLFSKVAAELEVYKKDPGT
jgi:hypothetical protein